MSTIIGLVSTFRLPLQEVYGSPKHYVKNAALDFKSKLVGEKVQKVPILK